ncbi:MAG: hypothetical protein JWM64_419 [Frankiales bacterium]|nr:hypothetical protein [Frankiales bacterium]
MVPLLVLAVVLVVAAVLLVRAAVSRSRQAGRLTATATSTCADLLDEARTVTASLGPGALQRDVEVKGVGEAEGTSLVGPYSGRPVLWYRAKVVHHYWKTTHSTDSKGHTSTSRTEATEVVSTETSDDVRVLVRDATGAVPVVLRGARVDRPELLHDRLQPAEAEETTLAVGPFSMTTRGGRDIGYQYVEEALLAGTTLYVCGTARSTPDGGVEVAGGDDLLVSTREEEDVVRGHVRWAQGLSVGGVLCGVGAVAAGVGALVV